MELEIEKSIPLPEKRKYPFNHMDVWDSFMFDRSCYNSVYPIVSRKNRKWAVEFKITRTEAWEYRVFRIK